MFLELYFKLTCLWFLATLSMPTLGLLIRKDQMSLLNHCFLFSWCKIKVQFKILHYFRHIFPHPFSIPHEDFVPLKQRTSQYILYKKKFLCITKTSVVWLKLFTSCSFYIIFSTYCLPEYRWFLCFSVWLVGLDEEFSAIYP